MKKRIITLITVLALVLSSVNFAFAVYDETNPVDTNDGEMHILIAPAPVSTAPAISVKVSAYDYNAVEKKIEGASETGVLFEETVEVPLGQPTVEAVEKALIQSGVPYVLSGSYLAEINGLGAAVGGYSGWCMSYNNDDFANWGMDYITLADGDVLEFHFSVNIDTVTDDIGNGWYGNDYFKTISLAGAEASAKSGSGSEADPYVVEIEAPYGTDLSKQTAEFTSSLGSHYRTVEGLEGDFSAPKALTIATNGGSKSYYTVKASVAATPFADVAEDEWFAESVIWAYENGITDGTSKTTFSPFVNCTGNQLSLFLERAGKSASLDTAAQTVTRADFVTAIWKLAGSPVVNQATGFTDIDGDSDYYNAVIWAYSKGITDGTSADKFSPELCVTRAQAVTFLNRFLSK